MALDRTMRNRRDRKFLKYVILLVIFGCLVTIGRQLYRWYELKNESKEAQIRIENLEKEQNKLEEEKKRLDTPEYVEKIAREEYNMVGKNEMPIFIVDDEATKTKSEDK